MPTPQTPKAISGRSRSKSVVKKQSTPIKKKSKSDPDSYFFGKFGTFFFDGRSLKGTPESVYHNLVEKIREDNRVIQCDAPEFSSNWSQRTKFYPYSKQEDNPSLLSNSDYIINLYFPSPILFEVLVPAKNQPLMNEVDDVPTDRYWVSWDGITLLVIWKRTRDEFRSATSAGHVVEQILRTAATSIGANLLVQPCSPPCENMFAHQDLRVTQIASAPNNAPLISCHEHPGRMVQLDINFEGDPLKFTKRVHGFIQSPSKDFARFKNISQRLIDLEKYARSLIDELLEMDLKNMAAQEKNPLARSRDAVKDFFKYFWTGKSPTRKSKRIISSLWIIMSRLEGQRLEWLKIQRRLNDNVSKENKYLLYDRDRKDDDLIVSAINTQFIRSAVEQKSNTIDARTIAWATIVGGVIGISLSLLFKL